MPRGATHTLHPHTRYTHTHAAVGFYNAVKDFVIIICVAIPLFTLNTFLEDRLVLAWRAFLTQTLLAAYFDNR